MAQSPQPNSLVFVNMRMRLNNPLSFGRITPPTFKKHFIEYFYTVVLQPLHTHTLSFISYHGSYNLLSPLIYNWLKHTHTRWTRCSQISFQLKSLSACLSPLSFLNSFLFFRKISFHSHSCHKQLESSSSLIREGQEQGSSQVYTHTHTQIDISHVN